MPKKRTNHGINVELESMIGTEVGIDPATLKNNLRDTLLDEFEVGRPAEH